jgi:hypothetical protein
MFDMNRLRELTAELGFMPATIDEADIERHRQLNKPRHPGQLPATSTTRWRPPLLRSSTGDAQRLKEGDIVLGGSFTRPIDIADGDVIHADYGPLGAIGVSFLRD